MNFTYFHIKNFKGIKDITLDLDKDPDSNIFTLVGLNESGKTTILEAISNLTYKAYDYNLLESPEIFGKYYIKDIHNCIPVAKKGNFNEEILIEIKLRLDRDDELLIMKYLMDELNFTIKNDIKNIIIKQTSKFKNSVYINSQSFWTININGRKKRSKKDIQLGSKETKEEWQKAVRYIISLIPNILYFPNFLFDFPEKIYLDESYDDDKNKLYRYVIQNILDSLKNGTNISEHILQRINSSNENNISSLESLLFTMSQDVTDNILKSWGDIFHDNSNIKNTHIKIISGSDEKGSYLEFKIGDKGGLYSINQRSLGFRWFFVFLLFTHYRKFSKNDIDKNILFLFDEPASNLHPIVQSQLLNIFKKLTDDNCKIIYTTHSHYLINPEWIECAYIVKNMAINYQDDLDFASSDYETDIKLQRYREFVANNPSQTTYFQPILEVLSYRPSALENIPDVVMVEGKNDFYIYNYINKIVFNGKYKLNFLPGTSSSNFELLISLYIGWGRKFILLLDSDDEGKKQKTRYEEIFKISLSNEILTLKDIDKSWDNFAAEKLFTDSERIDIQNKFLNSKDIKYDKVHFNRAIQELTLCNIKIPLEKNTEKNFKKIFMFLDESINR